MEAGITSQFLNKFFISHRVKVGRDGLTFGKRNTVL